LTPPTLFTSTSISVVALERFLDESLRSVGLDEIDR
jgi:hypothetical protein